MKTLVPTLLLAMSMISPVEASPVCDANFSLKQLHTMQQAYDYGKTYDLNYTLAAIVWKESSAGLKNINVIDPNKVGMTAKSPFHILLRTAYSREMCTDSVCRSQVRSRLKHDFDYAAWHAVEEILFWSRGGRTWNEAMARYNGGYTPKYGYARDLSEKVKYLKECIRFEGPEWLESPSLNPEETSTLLAKKRGK